MLAWALYDWANSAFATTVMAGFFPVFFRQYWSLGADPTRAPRAWDSPTASPASWSRCWRRSSARWRTAAASAGAGCSPGPLLGVLGTAGLYFAARGDWLLAALLYCLGTMGFNGGIVFYDSLLPMVAAPRDYDRVSAFGYALGYLGGGLLFAGQRRHGAATGLVRARLAGGGGAVRVPDGGDLVAGVQLPLMLGVRETARRTSRRAPAPRRPARWRTAGASSCARCAQRASSARCGCSSSPTGCTSTASTR